MKKLMKSYTAKFSNGTKYETTTSRPTAFAWRVECTSKEGTTHHSGGFSSSFPLAAKALDAWKARVIKNGATITFAAVAEAIED